MVLRRSAFRALFFWVVLVGFPAAAEEFTKGPAVIETAAGEQRRFVMEYAVTTGQREQGLMGRKLLGPDEGMIFDFGTMQSAVMWMKNTILSLDMLFVDEEGKVVGIAERTEPYSEDIIPSPGPVRYVIEINGGRAQALGITPGSRVVQGLKPRS